VKLTGYDLAAYPEPQADLSSTTASLADANYMCLELYRGYEAMAKGRLRASPEILTGW